MSSLMRSYPFLSASRRAILQQSLSDFLSSSPSSTFSSRPLKILWSSVTSWPSSSDDNSSSPISVAILDSSFNPPTSAHLSLLLNDPSDLSHDAHLLLFSTSNADKGTGKEGDATPLQRIEMMEILANEATRRLKLRHGDNHEPAVAVGIVDHPLIAPKSTLIKDHFKTLKVETQLHYLVGADTIPRFFSPKYYNPPNGTGLKETCQKMFGQEKTKMICARRSTSGDQKEEKEKEDELLESEFVREWHERGLVKIEDLLTEEEMKFSSTEIRGLVKELLDSDGKAEGAGKRLKECTIEGIREYLLTEKLYQ